MIRDLTDARARAIMDRHALYWRNGEWRRPLFRVAPPSPLVDTPEPYYLEPQRLDARAFKEGTERSFDAYGLLDGDLIRMVGTGITSEALAGCRIAVRHGTHWAEPCFRSWDQFDRYDVKETPWFKTLMDNTKRAVDALEADRYPFACMAFRGPVDMAAAVMESTPLCAATFEEPDRLKALLARLTDLIIETALSHGALLPSHRGGYFNSYGLWAPGRTVTFTVDAACLFSPASYEDFFLPCDLRLCQAFDAPFVHLHAASRQHFRSWAAIPNLGLQCVIDQAWLPPALSPTHAGGTKGEGTNRPIGPQLQELLPLFQETHERKSWMLYGYWEEAQIALALRELTPGGLAITGMVPDPEAVRRRHIQGEVWNTE